MTHDAASVRALLGEILAALSSAPESDDTRTLRERLERFVALSDDALTPAVLLEASAVPLGAMRIFPKEARGLVGSKANAIKPPHTGNNTAGADDNAPRSTATLTTTAEMPKPTVPAAR